MSKPRSKPAKRSKSAIPAGYTAVRADVKRLIAESRHPGIPWSGGGTLRARIPQSDLGQPAILPFFGRQPFGSRTGPDTLGEIR